MHFSPAQYIRICHTRLYFSPNSPFLLCSKGGEVGGGMEYDYGGAWTPENYVVEVVDCLLKQRVHDAKDDFIDIIGMILEGRLSRDGGQEDIKRVKPRLNPFCL